MTIGEAIKRLHAHWGEVHVDVGESGVTTVSNKSAAARTMSGPHLRGMKAHDQKTLEGALTAAISAEGLGESAS